MAAAPVNILLVDDQPANLQALEVILEGLGQNLVRASSGKEALKRLLNTEFAVILMDVCMPEMDGLETAALIRERDLSRHTPIIFLTAYEKTDVQMFEGYSLGAVDYLFKPLVPIILRSKVAVFVELFQKTEQVKQQVELLRQKEREEHESRLAAEKQRWEMDLLRREAERDKETSEILAHKAGELSHLNRAIQEADRRKDEFLAMLGHELRNPLAPISNALHILRQSGNDPQTTVEMYDILQRQVHHMSRLIDDLLDVSRISRGKLELRTQRLNLTEIISHAVESAHPLIGEYRHQLHVRVPDRPVWLDADPTRLEQVLANLLNNAAKYTEPGGRIDITVSPNQGADGLGDAVITVQDTGIGIPPDMVERIFELFTRVDRSLSSSTQWGMGIGLALVRTIVELHGGRVQASSSGAGQGSTFEVRLPLASAIDWEPPALAPPTIATSDRPVNVLVVDDNKPAVHSLALLLRKQGHRVRIAYDGPEALEAVRIHVPEVVLLDIGLPGMNGYEVARRLKEQDGFDRVVLVALTGYGQLEDRRSSQEAGFDHHLVKPVEPAALEEIFSQARTKKSGTLQDAVSST